MSAGNIFTLVTTIGVQHGSLHCYLSWEEAGTEHSTFTTRKEKHCACWAAGAYSYSCTDWPQGGDTPAMSVSHCCNWVCGSGGGLCAITPVHTRAFRVQWLKHTGAAQCEYSTSKPQSVCNADSVSVWQCGRCARVCMSIICACEYSRCGVYVQYSMCLDSGSRGCLVIKSLFILLHLSPSENWENRRQPGQGLDWIQPILKYLLACDTTQWRSRNAA